MSEKEFQEGWEAEEVKPGFKGNGSTSEADTAYSQDDEPGESMETQLAQKNMELEETRERILRLHADFENYRKRMQKEKEEWYQYASAGVIEKLLPVVDNLERALESLKPHSEEVQSLFSGVRMTHAQFLETLGREGLAPIATIGELFDPNLHEAIMQVPKEDGQVENQVVEELRKGYRFKEKILRPALVKVAKSN